MLGAAIGDALATPVEGAVGITEAQLSGWTRSRRVLRYTGLTATLITVGEHLAAADPHTPFDEQSLAEALVQNRRQAPWRRYDTMPGQVSQPTGLPTMHRIRPAGERQIGPGGCDGRGDGPWAVRHERYPGRLAGPVENAPRLTALADGLPCTRIATQRAANERSTPRHARVTRSR